MVRVKLSPGVASRLARFLASRSVGIKSDHWVHFSGLNEVSVEGEYAVVRGGSGFDSEYELNFRPPSVKQKLGRLARILMGTDPMQQHELAYKSIWGEGSGPARSPHEIIARHYLRLLDRCRPESFLEIGPGTGYLAALTHRRWGSTVTIIDLPEIIPFGFLYLHTSFPSATFALPNESHAAAFTFHTDTGRIPDNSVDLAANTASFGEMPMAVVRHYFHELRRALRPGGFFFTVNRKEKVMDGVPIRFADYPWSPNDRDLFHGPSRFHGFTQPQNPMVMRLCHLAKQ